MSPGISVVIPARDAEATLGRCLEGVASSDHPDLEVIVVDDGSRDRTGVIATGFSCRVLRHERPRGAAAARNTGARAAARGVLVFVDADILVRPDTFSRALGTLDRTGADGVVGLLARQTEHGNFPSQYENLYMHHAYATHPEEMDILYTSLAAVRREVFLEAGGFDERYSGAGIEDMELGQRLVAGGRRLVLDKGLTVVHLKRFSLGGLLRTNFRKASGTLRIMLRNLSAGIPARKHVAPPWRFVLGIPLTYAALGVLLAAAPLGSATCALAGAGLLALPVLLNVPFLGFLRRERGAAFLAAAVPFLLVNYVNYGLGIGHGLLGYARGARH